MQNRFWIITTGILFLIIAAGVYRFVFTGSVSKAAEDGRIGVVINHDEREFIKIEMREFLFTIESITAALASGEHDAIVERASRVGEAARHSVPGTLLAKLPLDFKKMGFHTHSLFEGIAEAARQGKSEKEILSALDATLKVCRACHSSYRFVYENDSF